MNFIKVKENKLSISNIQMLRTSMKDLKAVPRDSKNNNYWVL
jgi:hypothetical protein